MFFLKLPTWVVISFIFQIGINIYYGNSIGEISKNNPTYLTPDTITFIIWSFIYFFQLLLVIYQCGSENLSKIIRILLIIAFISNGIWCIFWYNGYWWLQFVDIYIYFMSLSYIYIINIRRYELNWKTFFSVVAISINLPWCLFASVISLTVALQNNNYTITETWAIVWIIIITVISNLIIIKNFDFIFGLIVVWALSGICRNQNIETSTLPLQLISENVFITSLACLSITLFSTLLFFILVLILKLISIYN